ncbi:MAG: universal stress protein [Myxococcales bacterium]|nr:universal stress protein [Myxococcales bacterium]
MNIMVAVDLADEPRAVLDRALPWAARFGARIHLRAVARVLWMPDEGMSGSAAVLLVEEWRRHRDQEAQELEELAATLPDHMAGTAKLLDGFPDMALVQASAGFDLVVVGTHGRKGLQRTLLGSVAERVVRRAPVPVLAIPLASEALLEAGPVRVAAPVRAKEPSLSAVAWARQRLGAQMDLHVVHALPDLRLSHELGLVPPSDTPQTHPHRAWAEETLKEAMAAADCEGQRHFVVSVGYNPGDQIAKLCTAQQADLIVMSTEGRTGLRRLAVSSVAERVLRFATCPVLIVR